MEDLYKQIDAELYKDADNVDKRMLNDIQRDELKYKAVFNGKTIDQLTLHDKLEMANRAYRETEEKMLAVFKDFNSIKEQHNEAKKYKEIIEAKINAEKTKAMTEVGKHIAETMIDIQKAAPPKTTAGLKFEDEKKTSEKT